MRDPRVQLRLLLVIPVLLAVATTIQAIAVNRASTLLPTSWTWASDPTVVWLVVVGAVLVTLGLAWALRRAEVVAARRADRRALDVRTEYAFQTTFGVHEPPSSAIRWKPMFQLLYSGARVLTIHDIVPFGPPRIANESREIRFVRTRASQYYRTYPTFGSLAEAHASGTVDDFYRVESWPLVLVPGQRMRVVVEHEYEMRLDGVPMSFASADEALQVFGPYFDLSQLEDGRYGIGQVLMPTRIVCADDIWEVDVPYLIMPIGATLLLPDIGDEGANDLI